MNYQTLALPTLGKPRPEFADVELIERYTGSPDARLDGHMVNELRINGVAVHTSLDEPITINAGRNDLTEVTVTLLVRSASIRSEAK